MATRKAVKKTPTKRRGRPPGQPGAGGRPPGPTMPCGWGCGAKLTATEMRPHFTECPKRPQ
jgi:hypothetical protein